MKKFFFVTLILIILIIGVAIKCTFFSQTKYTGEIIGVKGTYTYHKDTCQFVKKTNIKDLIFFPDIEHANNASYRPCKSCNPPVTLNKIDKTISKEYIQTEETAEIEISTEIKELLKKKEDGTYLTPLQQRKLDNYLMSIERLKQFDKDVSEGKIINLSKYDRNRVYMGLKTQGQYKNDKDRPLWFKILK